MQLHTSKRVQYHLKEKERMQEDLGEVEKQNHMMSIIIKGYHMEIERQKIALQEAGITPIDPSTIKLKPLTPKERVDRKPGLLNSPKRKQQ